MKKAVIPSCFAALGGALVLFLALYGGVWSLGTPFDLALSGGLLRTVALSAALGGLLYALPSRRLRWALAGLVCTTVALLAVLCWESVFLGAQALFHKISLGYHQALPRVLYYVMPVELTEEQLAGHACLFLSVCVPLLTLWLAFWLVGRHVVWPGVVTLCALPGVSLFILRSPEALPLGAVLLCLALTALSRRSWRDSAALGGRRVVTAAVPVALVMVLLWQVFPMDRYERPVWAEDLRLGLRGALQSLAASEGNVPDVPGTYSFPRSGAPRFDGHTVLSVRCDKPQKRMLLRGWSSATYTSEGWQPLSDEALAGLPDFAQEDRPWSYPAHAVLDSGGRDRVQSLDIVDTASNTAYYYTPYFPASMYTGALFHADSYIARLERQFTYTFDFLDPGRVPAGAQVGWNGGAYYREPEYRGFVYDHYLDVPYELFSEEAAGMIRDVERALEADQALSGRYTSASYSDERGFRIARARAVADYLASFTEYDLSVPAPPWGRDFVSWFLTSGRRGYCAHYASAATLMLRAMGIPARFTGGYVADLPGGSESVSIPDRNAHAWVEIYIDGFGWQPVDVTPAGEDEAAGQAQAGATPTPAPRPSSAPVSGEEAPEPPTPTPGPAALSPSQPPTETAGSGGKSAVLAVLAVFAGLAAVAGGTWLRRRLLLKRWQRRWAQVDPHAAAVWRYRYLLAVEKHLGLALPQRAVELAQKAVFSQHVLSEAELGELAAFDRAAREAAGAAPGAKGLALRWLWCLC